jgi:ABC-2 type transport system permease protein
MSKLFAVVRREFVTRVKTRAFLIGTFLGPVLMAALWTLPILLSKRDTGAKRVAIVDASSGQLGARIEAALGSARRGEGDEAKPSYVVSRIDAAGRADAVRDSLLPLTKEGREKSAELDGILMVDDSVLQAGRIVYLGTNVGSPDAMRALRQAVVPAIQGERLEATGVSPVVVMQALAPVEMQSFKVSEGKLTTESGAASFLLAYIMSFVLYLALILYGVQTMTSVVEEKSSRIVEVLVSSLRPFDLLLGKVIGVGAVGLLQIGIWAGAATLIGSNAGRIAELFGGSASAAASLPIPTMSPGLLAVFLLFFVLGFLFYSALYAAVGSMCNQVQETNQASTPVTLLIAGGLVLMFALLNEPNGQLARTLSLVPPFAPFVTPVRHSLTPLPIGEVLLSMAAMIAGLLAVVWLAARIYRVGILSYGKKPSFGELLQWVRQE